jgi:hypothetical protein
MADSSQNSYFARGCSRNASANTLIRIVLQRRGSHQRLQGRIETTRVRRDLVPVTNRNQPTDYRSCASILRAPDSPAQSCAARGLFDEQYHP